MDPRPVEKSLFSETQLIGSSCADEDWSVRGAFRDVADYRQVDRFNHLREATPRCAAKVVNIHLVGVPVARFGAKPHPMSVTIRLNSQFGTGFHGTTSLALETLHSTLRGRVPRAVLDYGCGSGVLGIYLARSGAKRVYMADISRSAIQTARMNARLNACSRHLRFRVASCAEQLRVRNLDLIVSNVLAGTNLRNLRAFGNMLAEGGGLILSGIYAGELSRVAALARLHGLRRISSVARGGWLQLYLRKT